MFTYSHRFYEKLQEQTDVEAILTKHSVCFNECFSDALTEVSGLYLDLFNYYLSDMPYGTAKARDEDPYQWIENRLFELLGE